MKTIIKFSVLGFLLGSPILCAASNWTKVTESSDSFYVMDFDSIATSGLYKKAWVKVIYYSPQKTTSYPTKQYQQTKVLYYFNCKAKTFTSNQIIYMEGADNDSPVVESIAPRFDPRSLIDVAPDSVAEGLMGAMCGTVADRVKIKRANVAEQKTIEEAMARRFSQP